MGDTATTTCPNCLKLQRQIDALQQQFDAQQRQFEQQLETLRATTERLQQQLAAARKDSSTSSKPPSSDVVKPPKTPPPQGTGPRTPGGQPGHPKHDRPLLPPTASLDHVPSCCPGCGGAVQPASEGVRVTQQFDVEAPPLHITEHRSHAAWCPQCHQVCYAPWPWEVRQGGMLGPALTTLVAYLKGVCHASYSTIRKFFRDVVGVVISRGELAKVIRRVTEALDRPYEELLQALPEQARLNVDETGHQENGQQLWTWCFRASLYTLFKIDGRRSADVLIEVVGEEYDGVLGCDYFGAYRRYLRECGVVLQFCLAHLIRDVKFLLTLPDARDVAYGKRLVGALRSLFGVIHQREHLSRTAFREQLVAARDEVLRAATADVPPTRHSQRLAKRFEEHGESYLRFVTTPEVEPTNNVAEQAIRFVVIDRHVTQGTRGEPGRRWCERIWTVIGTCSQQGRSIYGYLSEAVTAYFGGGSSPSLLPNPS